MFYEGGTGQIASRQATIKAGVNDLLGIPYIVSETGLRDPASYPNDISTYGQGMEMIDNNYRSTLNGGTGAIYYYQYCLGVKGGYEGPRTSGGTNSPVEPILATWLN